MDKIKNKNLPPQQNPSENPIIFNDNNNNDNDYDEDDNNIWYNIKLMIQIRWKMDNNNDDVYYLIIFFWIIYKHTHRETDSGIEWKTSVQ